MALYKLAYIIIIIIIYDRLEQKWVWGITPGNVLQSFMHFKELYQLFIIIS